MAAASGIPNGGNTCYLNSVIQCLRASGPFLDVVDSLPAATADSFANDLFESLYPPVPRKNLMHLIMSMRKDLGAGQVDPSHAFENIVTNLKAGESAEAAKAFESTMKQAIMCLECGESSDMSYSTPIVTCNPLFAWDDLESVLNDTLKSNVVVLDDDCAYACEHCKTKTKAVKTVSVQQYADVLVIAAQSRTHGMKACNISIDGNNYETIGIVVHTGADGNGHCVAYTRLAKKWYRCDDTCIVPVTIRQVDCQRPYMFFMQKV
jgi:ubiquitin C-terminal hydrolase